MVNGLSSRYLHTDDWVRFAQVYLDAARQGHSPILALQNALDEPAQVIETMIETARRRGFIQDTETPKGTWSLEVVSVAQALGVTFEQLTEAVRTYAQGVLRV